MKVKNKLDLTTGSILFKLLRVAIPTLLTSIVQMTYNLTDMFWVASVDRIGLISEEAVSAVGTIGFYPWFGFGIILLAKIGTSVKVSQAAGKNDMELLEKIGNNGFLLMLGFAILYTLFGYFGANAYVRLFNTGNIRIDTYAIDYMRVIVLAGTSYFMVNFFNGVYDGLGKTLSTFMITASGLFINIILDPIFILDEITFFNIITVNGLELGVKGAAYATAISQTFILLIYIVIYVSTYRPFSLRPIKQFSLSMMKKISSLGVYVTLQSVLFTIIAMVIGIIVVSYYGEGPMAIQRVGSQIEAVAWMVASGFQVALYSFVGQNFGAEQYDRVKEGFKTAMKLLIPYGIIINLVLFIFAKDLFKFFFDNPETLRLGKIYLEILSMSQLFMILELSTTGVFNGLGQTKIPSIVGVTGNLIRIPAAFVLMTGLGVSGIWWAVSITSILKGLVLTLWIILYLRKVGVKGGVLFENS
ncbi:MAG: MATE family efflux transporter [Candidatus Izimaplasma sp.]|nr:MATE family efflux transporter [Candidatus Izimaplasma bacterium]